jgi:hypothetical protein
MSVQCLACGAESTDDAQFCSQCGTPIVGLSAEAIPPAEAVQADQPAVTPDPPPPPEAPVAAETGPAPLESPPVVAVADVAQPAAPEAAPKKPGRWRLVLGLVLGLLVVAAAVVGGVFYMRGVGSARAAAQTAVARAETTVADAELAVEEGNDAGSAVTEAKSRLAQAKAKLASASPFLAAPYREAASLAGQASSAASSVLGDLDTALSDADSLRQSKDYAGAVKAWAALVKTYPRSLQADDARQAALDMLTTDVTDDIAVALEDDLQLSADIGAMFPSDSTPSELTDHVRTQLLDTAKSELDTLQGLATANADWAREIKRQGTISGDTVDAFQNQDYASSDVEWIQRVQGMLGKSQQPAQMVRLYAVITEATSLAAACKGVAANPKSQTSTSKTYTAAQINSVRDNAAAMQRDID